MDCRRGLWLMVALGLFLAGCGDQHQRQFRQEKRQFAIVMKSKLNQFDRRAADLATQVLEDSLHLAEVEALRGSHIELRGKIAGIDGATVGQWKEIKPAMEAEYYDLERRYYEIAGAVAAQQALEATTDTLSAQSLTPEDDVAGNTPDGAAVVADSVSDAAGIMNR